MATTPSQKYRGLPVRNHQGLMSQKVLARITLDAAIEARRITETEAHFVWLIYNGQFRRSVDATDMTKYFSILNKIRFPESNQQLVNFNSK
jgi:hypothetical protein